LASPRRRNSRAGRRLAGRTPALRRRPHRRARHLRVVRQELGLL